MKKIPHQLLLVSEFRKFIAASSSGRRLMSSGKKIRSGTIEQYECVFLLLEQFEKLQDEPLRITLLNRATLRLIQKEKNYWTRFFKKFSSFLYKNKNCYDQYVNSVFKVIKTFLNYLKIDKALPVGEFYKKFRIPSENINPVVLSPAQLKYLITSSEFESSLSPSLKRVKDIFIFGSTVALRYQDLMRLRKNNLQKAEDATYILLHTQKTNTEIKIPLPDYALDILSKYKKKATPFLLPRLSSVNLNIGIKLLMKAAGWNYNLPKMRQRQGESVEIKNKLGKTYKFYEHVTAHSMRRTAITTLLLMGVDENSVRRISGHAAGSKEFYKYVVIVQDYLNSTVKAAYLKLINEDELTVQKVA